MFREGRTKGIGMVVGTEHNGPLAAPDSAASEATVHNSQSTAVPADAGSVPAGGGAAGGGGSGDGGGIIVATAINGNSTCAAGAAAGHPDHAQRKDQAVGR